MDAVAESTGKMPTMCTGPTVPLSASADAGSAWQSWVERTSLRIWCLVKTPYSWHATLFGRYNQRLVSKWMATRCSTTRFPPLRVVIHVLQQMQCRSGRGPGVISPSLNQCCLDDTINKAWALDKQDDPGCRTWAAAAGIPTRGARGCCRLSNARACEACRYCEF